MRVRLRNPDRVVEVHGAPTVARLLERLEIVPEAVLVIRDATLLTRDERLDEDDDVEVRPVLSGGCGGVARPERPPGIEGASQRLPAMEGGRERPSGASAASEGGGQS